MRMTDDMLPHRIDVTLPGVRTGSGYKPGTARTDVPADVHSGLYLVRDERPKSSSETSGQEVAASVRVFLQPEDFVPLGASMLVHKGTPAQRLVDVVRVRYEVDELTPESAQAWGV